MRSSGADPRCLGFPLEFLLVLPGQALTERRRQERWERSERMASLWRSGCNDIKGPSIEIHRNSGGEKKHFKHSALTNKTTTQMTRKLPQGPCGKGRCDKESGTASASMSTGVCVSISTLRSSETATSAGAATPWGWNIMPPLVWAAGLFMGQSVDTP